MIIQVIKDAIRDTFVYSGRSERLEHWTFLLFTGIFVVIFQLMARNDLIMIVPINWIVLILAIWLFLANVSLMVRRLHDHDLSGFWLLLPLVPIFMMLIAAKVMYGTPVTFMTAEEGQTLFKISQAGMISVFILFGSMFVRPGNKKDNRFGPPVG